MSDTVQVAYLIGDNGDITLFVNGKNFVVGTGHPNYKAINWSLSNKEYDDLETLVDIPAAIEEYTEKTLTIEDGRILFGGHEVQHPLVSRIMSLMEGDYPFEFMLNFLENLLNNPSETAVNELYDFMGRNSLPITEDGCFLAYKKVQDNYLDFYTSTVSNKVGEKPTMDRDQVDPDRNNTCSVGYHFCSFSYLPSYYGGKGRVMIVKVNPKDVVSFPTDFEVAKGRCCSYEVIGEHEGHDQKEAFDKPAYKSDGTDWDEGWDEDEICPDCQEHVDDCVCDEMCDGCGNHQDDCTCNICPDCGLSTEPYPNGCTCQEDNDLDGDLSKKPSGQFYYSVRDTNTGRFTKKD